jgi:hypothetical protein
MKFGTTSETTFYLPFESLSDMRTYGRTLNGYITDLDEQVIELFGIVFVIMNPDIASPFPGGIIFRRKRRELDCKSVVDFADWVAAGREGRLRIVHDRTLELIEMTMSKYLPRSEIGALVDASRRTFSEMANALLS